MAHCRGPTTSIDAIILLLTRTAAREFIKVNASFLSVQCYAWTEYKFTCVSVCLSVTLSVNSPTGQTPQRIFTVDSLKDADLRKNVPLGGLDDE